MTVKGSLSRATGRSHVATRAALRNGATASGPAFGDATFNGLPTLSNFKNVFARFDPEQAVERYRDLARRPKGLSEDLAATLDKEQAQFVRGLSAKNAAYVTGRWRNSILV